MALFKLTQTLQVAIYSFKMNVLGHMAVNDKMTPLKRPLLV